VNHRHTAILFTLLSIALTACSRNSTPAPEVVRPGEPAKGDIAATEPSAPLTAQQFESGESKMMDVPALALESFLFDLRQRRDYDLSQHNGQPGPDAEYLNRWIDTTNIELARRGYATDADGTLHRPSNGPIIDMR
jgi:hypothetical protein